MAAGDGDDRSSSSYGQSEHSCCLCREEFLTRSALADHLTSSHCPALYEDKEEPRRRGDDKRASVPPKQTPVTTSSAFRALMFERESVEAAVNLMLLASDRSPGAFNEPSAKNSISFEDRGYWKVSEFDISIGQYLIDLKKKRISSSCRGELKRLIDELNKTSPEMEVEPLATKNAGERRSQYECKNCKRTFSSSKALGGQSRHCRGKLTDTYPCPKCRKLFNSIPAMVEHVINHPDARKEPFQFDLNSPPPT